MAASRKPKTDKKKSQKVANEPSFKIGPGHKESMKGQKIYNKGKSTTNPHEKEIFLRRTGPQLPLARRRTGRSNIA